MEKQLNNEKQLTENGAIGYRTSGKALLDLNFAVSSMRNWNEDEIVNAVRKMVALSPAERQEMGKRNRELCMTRNTEEAFLNSYVDLIDRL